MLDMSIIYYTYFSPSKFDIILYIFLKVHGYNQQITNRYNLRYKKLLK